MKPMTSNLEGAAEDDKSSKPTANEIEAANRAEATALLIRSGYRVYRPEADCFGEDLILRTPSGDIRKDRHAHTPKWNNAWSYPGIPRDLSVFLKPFRLLPQAKPGLFRQRNNRQL